MLSIVGTRIYLHEDDTCAFKIMYERSEEIHNFTAEDILSLTIRDRNTRERIITKVAESINVEGEATSVFIFHPFEISSGDYIYDIMLETLAGSSHVLIDRAFFNVLKGNSTSNLLDGEFAPHRLDSIRSDMICIHETPLVCKFNYVSIEKKEEDGTLILFNRSILDGRKDEDADSDDTLILYDKVMPQDEEKSEDTLILF